MNINDSNIRPELTFRRLVYLHMQQLTNFPYIEQDFDALTDYELLCLVVKYLNDVITNSNEQNQSITNLYNAFLELQTYMNNSVQELEDEWNDKTNELEEAWTDKTTELETAFNNLQAWIDNYFDNLDVQEEINNKLDQMLEDGVLEQIIEQFLQSTALWCFDTVASMKQASNLISGSYAKTLGYYSVNDGGSGVYKITNTESQTEYQETLNSGLYATLIIENNTINFKQLGAIPSELSGTHNDCKNYLLKYVDICNNANTTYKLFIPTGNWYFSETHILRNYGVHIYGVGAWASRGFYGTRILPMSNQNYIWKFGGESNMNDTLLDYNAASPSNNIHDLTFSSPDYKISYGCLCLEYSNFGIYKNLFFKEIKGTALYIRSSWENYFDLINFRQIYDWTLPVVWFGAIRPIDGVSANISATSFDHVMFEETAGDLFYFEYGCAVDNCQFGEINAEMAIALQDGEERHDATSGDDFSTKIPFYMFKGNARYTTIDTINITGLDSDKSRYYSALDGNDYYFDGLFKSYENQNSNINDGFQLSVNIISTNNSIKVLTSKDTFNPAFSFTVNTINENANVLQLFEVNNTGKINVGVYNSRTSVVELSQPSLFMYKAANNNGAKGNVTSDQTALNPLKLCLQAAPDIWWTINERLKYPFNYSATKKKIYILRAKCTDGAGGNFTIKGTANGANVTKQYTLASGSSDWQYIEVEMNFDAGSDIKMNYVGTNILFDILTYDRDENI